MSKEKFFGGFKFWNILLITIFLSVAKSKSPPKQIIVDRHAKYRNEIAGTH